MPSQNRYGARLQHLNLYLLALGILFATTCMRLDQILGMPWIKIAFHAYFMCLLAVGFLTLASLNFRRMLVVSLFGGLLLLQSFAYLFQPSLHADVPVQDWLLADTVSANYSFDQVCLYLRNLFTFIVPVLALNLSHSISIKIRHTVLLCAIGLALMINSSVCLIQGFMGLSILAQGSGTAVGALRAAGLLEDSGASTVYFAMMVSGIFSIILLSNYQTRQTPILAVALLLVTSAGAQTSGRIFFVASIIPVLIISCLGTIRIFRKKNLRYAVYVSAASGIVFAVFFFLIRWKMTDTTIANFVRNSFADGIKFTDMITALDPVRSTHGRIMMKTFLENPIFGAGLGSFYSNLQEHSVWVSQYGGQFYPDPPGSFYLMLASELGILGILIILLMLWVSFVRSKLAVANSLSLSSAFYFGCFLSLMFSLLIGVHFLFLSVSSIIGLAFFSRSSLFDSRQEGFNRNTSTASQKFIGFGFATYAVLGIASAYILAPRPPAFRWLARGKPQVPVSMNVPIKAPGTGSWLHSGAEVLLPTSDFRFFVELPSGSYPLEVSIKVRDEAGRELAHGNHRIEKYTLPKPGKILSFSLPSHLNKTCFSEVSPANFCSVSVQTNPPWKIGSAEVGFFVDSKQLESPLIVSQAGEKDLFKN